MSISKVSGKTTSAVEQAKPKAETRQAKGAFRDAMKNVEDRDQAKHAEARKTSTERQELERQEVEQPSVEKPEIDEPEAEVLSELESKPEAEPGVTEAKPERLRDESGEELKTRLDSEERIDTREEEPPDELMAAGLQPMDAGVAIDGQVEVQASTGPEARHEVVQKLIETMVSGGQLGEDSKGRKVMMMDVNCPGRGNVRVRLWKKGDGIELRMRADNPELKSLLLLGRADLQSSAKEKGVNFSKIEVAE